MNRSLNFARVPAICVAVTALAFATQAAADPRFEGIVSALAGDDEDRRQAAVDQAPAYAPDAIGAVVPLLGHADPVVRTAARDAIAAIAEGASAREETRAVAGAALLGALDAVEDPAWIIATLGRHGGPEHLDGLLDLLDARPALRIPAIAAITRIGLNLPDTSGAMPRSVGPLRWLVRQLGWYDRPEPSPRALLAGALAIRVERADPEERAALVDALGALGEAVAAPALIPLLAVEPNAGVVAALGSIGDARACEALRAHYAAHGGAHNLAAYARALDQQPATTATRGFAALLGDDNPGAQTTGIQGIVRHGTSTHFVERIAAFLVSGHPEVRDAAETALLAFEGEEFDRAMVRVVRRAGPARKARLLPLLAQRDPSLARAEAAPLRDHPDPEVRDAARAILGDPPAPAQEQAGAE